MKLKTLLTYSHRLIFAIFVVFLYTSVVHAGSVDWGNVESKSRCPDLSGAWQRGGDNMVIVYEQKDCDVTSISANSAGFDHQVNLKWEDSKQRFRLLVDRKNLATGCITRMYGFITVVNRNKYVADIFGSDGRCPDLPTNYTETSTWIRK